MITESLHFTFDGINSHEAFGIMNVNVNSGGLLQEAFLPRRSVLKSTIRGGKTYFHDIEQSNLSFSVSFVFKDSFDEEQIRAVARWLNVDYYKPLIFSEQPDRIYYAIPVEDSQLIHNGLKQGYLQLTFSCSHPWSFSPAYTTQVHDLADNTAEGTEIIIANNGDLTTYPIISVTVLSGNTFSVLNKTTGKSIAFNNMTEDESIRIDCENQDIVSDLPGAYRFEDMEGEYIALVRGNNRLQVYGNISIQFKYEFLRLG